MNERAKPRPAGKKDIVAAIKRAGYPMEQRVAVILDRVGFAPIVSWVWRDERRNDVRGPIDRELDLAASAEFGSSGGVYLNLHLLIECKRFSDGMVVFEAADTATSADAPLFFDDHYWGQPRIVFASPERTGGGSPLGTFGWMSEHWPAAAVEAYQYGVAHRIKDKNEWMIDHAEAHDSVEGLARALHVYRGGLQEQIITGNLTPVNFAALAVVVEGPIYAHRVAVPQPNAPAPVSSSTPRTTAACCADGRRTAVRIDFVRERALAKYVEAIAATGRRWRLVGRPWRLRFGTPSRDRVTRATREKSTDESRLQTVRARGSSRGGRGDRRSRARQRFGGRSGPSRATSRRRS
ncbi:MAG: hypothetical protein U0353_30840 [Sandaracinus sp.]